ncbi:hypothetical protein BAUCODRAFT_33592 [Baudoinia panamericana UAMH 10762]|uniref:RBR-type E3 ubiquitin transferase n=1 Tax=Baudoinia panamericana (strain UAMH 10762) TaxID=717646 RepID=M2LPD2_BAUPA|nr:uncharacterized protein BAUCODRAFT_33592 [Baudoinia panamericana UAMH 10762]EMC96247.1 hypothetical protein BAUCODRAFT_33592 [Baudoinia panamericana UAMH 10762]
MAEDDERTEELGSLEAIYPEFNIDHDRFSATLELAVTPSKPLLVRFIPQVTNNGKGSSYAQAATNGNAHIERDVELSHLPPLHIESTLPDGYPSTVAPKVTLTTQHDWLPKDRLVELESQVERLWNEYGRCQILYVYVDFLQQAVERSFDLDQCADGCLVLPSTTEKLLTDFDEATKVSIFNAGTYDCGICLEPKKGTRCYRMKKCGHVFCLQCLQDFYNNAITEGDITGVRCLDPTCGKDLAMAGDGRKRKRESKRTLHPRELLAMGVEESMVRRYVEMKRKKKLEADKTTIYCPRTWCQSPARSNKYPPIPADLTLYAGDDSSSDEDHVESGANRDGSATSGKASKGPPADPADRLAVCEKCNLAFCRVCYMGWHGPFARCFPRDPTELSAEEKASYDYIRLHTSPCPTCSSPTQKTMGCNHMNCFQCNTHFCYLCGAWLDGGNPYQHFNKPGSECYQRLWELEEGDEGQGPEDGRGFAGGRRWEQMAIEAAREADAAEAAQLAQVEMVAPPAAAAQLEPIAVHMAQIRLNDEPVVEAQVRQRPNGRRRQNPFPARPPAQGQAQAVRRHERAGAGRNGTNQRGNPLAQDDGLQRFLELAQRDEEDGWDSDELDEDDVRFVIR